MRRKLLMGAKLEVFLIVKALKICNPGSRSGTYVATIATQIGYVATIATQNGYFAILSDRNVCATLRDPRRFKNKKIPKIKPNGTHKEHVTTLGNQKRHFARVQNHLVMKLLKIKTGTSQLPRVEIDVSRPSRDEMSMM